VHLSNVLECCYVSMQVCNRSKSEKNVSRIEVLITKKNLWLKGSKQTNRSWNITILKTCSNLKSWSKKVLRRGNNRNDTLFFSSSCKLKIPKFFVSSYDLSIFADFYFWTFFIYEIDWKICIHYTCLYFCVKMKFMVEQNEAIFPSYVVKYSFFFNAWVIFSISAF